jgi:phosphoadenosine phosphosulfate reductase
MTSSDLASLQVQLQGKSAQEILTWGLAKFGSKIALASSFGAEDMVLIDLMSEIQADARIFTLDTGRLPVETYDLIAAVEKKYPQLQIQIMFPQADVVEEMVQSKGINLFYDSVDNRKLCCKVRKLEPLSRAIAGLDAWITGIRSDQTASRNDMQVLELDKEVYKLNPLIDWNEAQVWEYIRSRGIPYNALHDRNFPSIGCAPCTRAIAANEDPRAGRWWWEMDNKECGLHVNADGKFVPAKSMSANLVN